ncbi:MAG TPA: cytochrome c [Gaiellaceae bacterium]
MLLALTGTAKTVLLIVAVAFIVYALITSMVIPRRNPGFPGKNLGAFITVTALFFAVQMGTVWWATSQEGEEHGEEAVPAETQPGETETEPAETETEPAVTETEPSETETEPAVTETEPSETETEPAETETEPAATETEAEGTGDAAAGEAVFASAGCGTCHTLAAAGTSGTIGPSLDDTSPSYDKVVERVTQGKGVMPSFADQLSEQQIQDVAAFVSSSVES